jgi:hydrogenase maturation protein HypF
MLSQLCGGKAARVACDKHPGYDSTRFAERCGLPLFPVQHHLAHLLACLLEHQLPPDNILGVVWDGTGFGEDGSVWGGEFLLARGGRVSRFAHLRRFSLPGGDAASRDARRPLLALLHEENPAQARSLGPQLGFTETELGTLCAMLSRHLNAPRSSSMGRLFDAAAVLLGLGRHNSFEGQLPLGMEALAWRALHREGTREQDPDAAHSCHFALRPAADSGCLEADWHAALLHLQDTVHEPAERALHFHKGLARLIVEVARHAGARTVALSGGCFQNLLLLELTRAALRREGFTVVSHRILPPGDGSIAAGQALGALLGLGTVHIPRKA